MSKIQVVKSWSSDVAGAAAALAAHEADTTSIHGIADTTLLATKAYADAADAAALTAANLAYLKTIAHGQLISGQYYSTMNDLSLTAVAATLNVLRLYPYIVPNAITVAKLGCEVTTGGGAGSLFRPAVYADDGTGYPGALLSDPGTIDGNSVTSQEIGSLTIPFPKGLIWVGGVGQVAAPTMRTMNFHAIRDDIVIRHGTAWPGATTYFGYQQSSVSGALPSNFTATPALCSTSIARIFFKTA